MRNKEMAKEIVRDMERTTPYIYEGLYGSFLSNYIDSDKSKWTSGLSAYLGTVNHQWSHLNEEIASLLWEEFERRISC